MRDFARNIFRAILPGQNEGIAAVAEVLKVRAVRDKAALRSNPEGMGVPGPSI